MKLFELLEREICWLWQNYDVAFMFRIHVLLNEIHVVHGRKSQTMFFLFHWANGINAS